MTEQQSTLSILVCLLLFSCLVTLSVSAKSKSHRHTTNTKSNSGKQNSRVPTSYSLHSMYAQDELPKVRMYMQMNSKTSGRERRLILEAENSVLVLGEDIPLTGNVVLECSASYPVTWKYEGEGFPSFEVNTSAIEPQHPFGMRKAMKEQQTSPLPPLIRNENPDGFIAYSFASLGKASSLTEQQTGNYSCIHILHKEIASFVYIYVPGRSLFVSTKKETFNRLPSPPKMSPTFDLEGKLQTAELLTVRIPCTVSNPKVTVHLQKSVNGVLMPCSMPLNNSIRYSPATGFHIPYTKECDVAGTYVCTASYNETFQISKHTVFPSKDCVPMIEPAMSFHENKEKHMNMSLSHPMKYKHVCKTFTCGYNARCREINKEPICSCYENFTGNPYSECRHIHSAFFFQTDNPCNPEIRNEICGPNSVCENVDGLAVCSCHHNYTGDPPTCHSKSCTVNTDCPSDQFCYNKKCEDPCGACGRNSICSVTDHVPNCQCKKGYDGDPYTVCCLPDPDTGEYPCRPKYCSRSDDCSPVQKCRGGRCRDVCHGPICGAHAVCGVADRKAFCSCEAGFTGDPYSSQCQEISPERNPTDSLESTLWFSSDEKGSSAEIGYEKMCAAKRNFCAEEAQCRVIGKVPICKCKPGYFGDPYKVCFEEKIFTVSIEDEDPKNRNLAVNATAARDPCKEEFPSPCGKGAECDTENGKAICSCPAGTHGDPRNSCKPDSLPPPMIQIVPMAFPFRIPIPVSSIIKATEAHSHSHSHKHVTSIGNAGKKNPSRPTTCGSVELGVPSPCGPHTQCNLFNTLPLCSCLPGYSWVMSTCQPTPPTTESYLTCLKNSDCPSKELCRKGQCVISEYYTKPDEVCSPSPCGPHAVCRVQEETHRPICQCKYTKYGGNPPRCKPECIVDADCSQEKEESICSRYGECVPGSRY